MDRGHITNPNFSMTYVSVFSCDSVHLELLISALDDLNILAGEIQNKYLNAPKKQKIVFYDVDECKYDLGKVVVIVRDLYGLKSSALS